MDGIFVLKYIPSGTHRPASSPITDRPSRASGARDWPSLGCEPMTDTKTLDLICLGRAAVDLYGEQIGSRLEDMSGFAKYLGGSSGNIAYGTARMGLKSAMLTRV